MKRKGIGSHTRPNSGASVSWLSPPEIVQALGSFDMDPCCPPEMPWRTASMMIHWPCDGLYSCHWFGRVWLNPPYGAEGWEWVAKLAQHGNGIAILFARTETKGFFETVWECANGLLFIRNRLHFHRHDGTRAKGNAGGPSVLVAYGKGNADCLRQCGIPGAFVPLR